MYLLFSWQSLCELLAGLDAIFTLILHNLHNKLYITSYTIHVNMYIIACHNITHCVICHVLIYK